MKARLTLLCLILAGSMLSGCTTAARQNTAMAAAQYGTDVTVVDKLASGRPLSFADLEELGRRRVPDNVILAHLRRREDIYRLKASDVVRLRDAGLSDRVINYLLDSRARYVLRSRRYYPVYGYGRYGGFGHSSGFGHGGFGHGGGHHFGGHH